jgi:hypothetical protein
LDCVSSHYINEIVIVANCRPLFCIIFGKNKTHLACDRDNKVSKDDAMLPKKNLDYYFFAKPILLPYNINYRLDCVIFLEAVIAIE